MIPIQTLIDDLTQANGPLTSDWMIEWAWTMAPVEPEDLPYAVPLLALYQGEEVCSPREGSPCFQSATSTVMALIICHKTELDQRVAATRQALIGWQAAGDEQHSPLYLSDDLSKPCRPLDIKGEYLWWQDVYLTHYPLLPMQTL